MNNQKIMCNASATPVSERTNNLDSDSDKICFNTCKNYDSLS